MSFIEILTMDSYETINNNVGKREIYSFVNHLITSDKGGDYFV